MVCLNLRLLCLSLRCLCVICIFRVLKWDSVSVCLQPSLCALLSLNNTNENTKTHILTSAVSWCCGALYWLHSCVVQSSLEVLECKLKLLMRPSSIPLLSQTQNKDRTEEGDDCPAFFRYVKNISVRVVSLLFDLSKYSLHFDNSTLSTFLLNKCTKKNVERWQHARLFCRFPSCYQDNIKECCRHILFFFF